MPITFPAESAKRQQLFSNLSEAMHRRNRLVQELINRIQNASFPVIADISSSYTIQDAEAVKRVFENIGLRIELRFVSNGNPYFRFYEG